MSSNDPKANTPSIEHPPGDGPADREPASMVVTDAIAAAADADPTEIEPLYHSIDPDVLDKLFEARDRTAPADRSLSFQHMGFVVTVTADPDVAVDVTEA